MPLEESIIYTQMMRGTQIKDKGNQIRGGDEIGGQPEEKYTTVTRVEREDQVQMALVLEVENVNYVWYGVCVCVCMCVFPFTADSYSNQEYIKFVLSILMDI